jgi:hypothetical protein
MSQSDAPVLLIVHRRPEQTRRVLEAVAKARPRRFFVAADGPATAADLEACELTRAVVGQVDWDCTVAYDFSDRNLGLDARVVSALNWVFESADSAIVLEDDCLPHERFFTFCAAMLERYRDDQRIVHVSGECYRSVRPGDDSYLFSKYPLAWGWATWSRAWSLFDSRLSTWPRFRASPEARALFDSRDERRYWFATFDRVHQTSLDVARDGPEHSRRAGATRLSSWDYAWYYACMANGLSIHPAVNLVSNIGYGPLASHTFGSSELSNRRRQTLENDLRHPASVVRDSQADMDTFERRFPGGILRQQRSLRHQLGRPGRWAARLLRRQQ